MRYRLFIDESCHLEHDNIPVMCIGYIKVPDAAYVRLKEELHQIKLKHKTPSELKWNKVSNSRMAYYKEIIDYFFDNPLLFRCILIKYKDRLKHKDFEEETLEIDGKTVKIITQKSKIAVYNTYAETFTHLVTREIKSLRYRSFDSKRANRIHWVKPILENRASKKILYYKWKDNKGLCKDHYWFWEGGYMVVLKEIAPNLQIVTAFCVDKDEQITYLDRHKNYEDGKSDC